MQNKNSNITWKHYEVSTTAPDGTLLKGEIRYWPKDYTVYLTEPFEAKGRGGHLMYAIPAVYVTDEAEREGVYQFRLIEIAEEDLLALYSGKGKPCCS